MSETWLTDSILDNDILPNGFSIFRQDRVSRGRGVLLAIADNLPCTRCICPLDVELVAVDIFSVTICALYIPPSASEHYFTALLQIFF